jgi:hypothetical protein
MRALRHDRKHRAAGPAGHPLLHPAHHPGERHLLDRNRIYYRLLRQIVLEGQDAGQIRRDISSNDLTRAYAMCERALLYDWCICNGEYSSAPTPPG